MQKDKWMVIITNDPLEVKPFNLLIWTYKGISLFWNIILNRWVYSDIISCDYLIIGAPSHNSLSGVVKHTNCLPINHVHQIFIFLSQRFYVAGKLWQHCPPIKTTRKEKLKLREKRLEESLLQKIVLCHTSSLRKKYIADHKHTCSERQI